MALDRAIDDVQLLLDAHAVSTGSALTCIFESCVLPDGTRQPMVSVNPFLNGLVAMSSDQIVELSQGNSSVRHALNDLASGLRRGHNANFDCARAVEAIKHIITPGAAGEGEKWRAMRDALRIDRSYLDL